MECDGRAVWKWKFLTEWVSKYIHPLPVLGFGFFLGQVFGHVFKGNRKDWEDFLVFFFFFATLLLANLNRGSTVSY